MVRVLSRTPLVQRIRRARRTIPVGCLFLYDHLIFFMSFVDSLSLSFIFFSLLTRCLMDIWTC
ncbi:hypothetical protein HETIRDRAFT_318944 [Heterobasidion irregulare TC 32-1]|uniref:Uncharacterized protein n=1 Tax=Heterobasidion irregulare (strain TC 32-1) TaxID=747525 RepID=W4K8V0_HETIT|nr:uncharacterized protein HETIRDRAFT_318944 [Heterobasidion irregulare TC 32-1]ETW82179.1 hypothetical protein HETIRDRAFT_318944 [Heterobasidion irregulare TC 32-1]